MTSHQNFITLCFCVLTEITVFFLWHGIKYIPIMFLLWAYLVTTHLCTEFNFLWLCSQHLLYFSPNVFGNCVLLLNYKINDIMWQIGLIYFTLNKIVLFSTVFVFLSIVFISRSNQRTCCLTSQLYQLPAGCASLCASATIVCALWGIVIMIKNTPISIWCNYVLWWSDWVIYRQPEDNCWQTVEHASVMKEVNPHVRTLTCKPAWYHHSIIQGTYM